MFANFIIVLDVDDVVNEGQVDISFQAEEEILVLLKQNKESYELTEKERYTFQQPLAVVWDGSAGREWFIGLYLDENDYGTFRIDHLMRDVKEKDDEWKRPRTDDIQDVEQVQILPCQVDGEWHLSCRKSIFKLRNTRESRDTFMSF